MWPWWFSVARPGFAPLRDWAVPVSLEPGMTYRMRLEARRPAVRRDPDEYDGFSWHFADAWAGPVTGRDGFTGEMEVDTNQDVKAEIIALTGSLALNQVAAVSRLTVPGDLIFTARKRGVGNALFFEQAGQRTEDFSTPDAETLIELNGMKSELYICRK